MDAMAKVISKNGLFFTASLVQAHDILAPGPIKTAQDQYFRAFREAHFTPEPGSSYAWDPSLILIDALRHLGTDASAQQIRKNVEGNHGLRRHPRRLRFFQGRLAARSHALGRHRRALVT